nr:phosphatidylinositol-binding protein scs2 [Polyrhizophydium stewartii]
MDSAKYLIIEPDKELNFRRPFTTVTKQTLTVINAHPDSPIAFKVKTTAPKQYCVRPNAGRLLPGDRCEVQVLLQAMREDPPPSFKCRDKFLVLALRIPHDVMALDADQAAPRLQELWAHADQIKASAPDAAAELLVERKLRCAFLPAAGAADLPSTGAPPAAAQHLPPLPAAAHRVTHR